MKISVPSFHSLQKFIFTCSMIQKISTFFLSIANWKTFAGALIVYLVFGAYVMPHGAKKIEELSGKKIEILDLQFSYSPGKAKAILADYNDASRSFAIKFGLIADTIYPLAYTFFFLVITSMIFKGLLNRGVKTGYLHLFPLLILPLDYLENVCIVNLMKNFPAISDMQVHMASFFTSVKWIFVAALAAIIIYGLARLSIKSLSKAN
jgi:hypothetical protein